jgi:hypothetical protein
MKSFFILVKFYIYDFTTKKNINLYLSTNNKRGKMKKKMIILMSAFIVFTQPLKADEDKINKIIEKLNSVVECINKEFEEIKEFQNTQFSNAKKQKAKELDLVKHKLTGFFSDFPTINQEDK